MHTLAPELSDRVDSCASGAALPTSRPRRTSFLTGKARIAALNAAEKHDR